MEDIKHATKERIKEITEEGITSNNIEWLSELVDINKDLSEIECNKMKAGEEMRYSERGYRGYDGYGRDEYGNYGRDEYGRGSYGRDSYNARRRDSRGRYKGHDYLDDMYDSYGRYMENRSTYGTGEDTKKSLKYMLESMEDFARMLKEDAQSQEEVEMIRQTAQRIAQM